MSKFKHNKSKTAFTIIEVVLVLAIAGLIFLMVFVALPALQRNQRDAQRKNDVARVISALSSYRANNRGRVLTTGDNLRLILGERYLKINGETFADPDGSEYELTLSASDPRPQIARKHPTGRTWIFIFRGAACNTDSEGASTIPPIAGSTRMAVLISLEGGGIYCVDA